MAKAYREVHEEVLITGDQEVINFKLADGTYRVKAAVPLTQVEMRDGQPVVAMGSTMVCYILVKLQEVEGE